MYNDYPFEPDGEPVEQVELALVEGINFQDPDDQGLWSRLKGFHVGEFVAAYHIFADVIGDNMGFGEVAIETENLGIIQEGSKVTIREIAKDNKGKIAVGAVLGVSMVAAGTLRAVYKKRDNS